MGNYTLPDQDCIPVVGSSIADVPTHRDYFRFLRGTGVLPDIGGMLVVEESADQGDGPAVDVADGQAWIVGHLWRLEVSQTLDLAAADLSDPRVDLIVARVVPFDGADDGFGELAVVTGTPGGGTPSLTQDDGGVWELPLAEVTVETASPTVSAVVDTRAVSESTVERPVIVDEVADLGDVNVDFHRTAVVRGSSSLLYWYDPDAEDWSVIVGEGIPEAQADELYQPRRLHIERADKDADDIFRTVRHKRVDGSLFSESVLGPVGDGPEYPEREVTWYEADGSTVRDSVTYDLTYDGDGDLTSEAVQA